MDSGSSRGDTIHLETRSRRKGTSTLITYYLWFRQLLFSYFAAHVIYFVFVCFIGSCILILSEDIAYIDALFISASAVCVTGLSTVDFSQFTQFGQVVVMFLIMLGGIVFHTIPPLVYRYFQLIRHKEYYEGKTMYVSGKYNASLSRMVRKLLPPATQHKLGLDPYDETSDLMEVDEYQFRKRVLRVLIVVVGTYYIVFNLLGMSILMIYTSLSPRARASRHTPYGDINAVFFGVFETVSSFNNTGFSLYVDNLISANSQWVVLVVMGCMILIGNSAYPVVLRFVIFLLYLIDSPRGQVYRELLVSPRKYFSHLFGSATTAWLIVTLIFNTGIQWMFTCIFEWNHSLFGLSGAYKVLNALFQSLSTRTAGFNSIPLSESNPGILVLYVGMMYISVYPLLVSMRQSNVEIVSHLQSRATRVLEQVKFLVIRELFCAFMAVFLIALIQGTDFYWQTNNVDTHGILLPDDVEGDVTLFALIFEVVSAYGTVGLSLGVQSAAYSMSLESLVESHCHYCDALWKTSTVANSH